MELEIRSAYSPKECHRFSQDYSGHSLAKQSFKDECDINKIMLRYEQTGILEHAREHQGRYGDFLDVPTYQEALNGIQDAQEAFMSLPATVRDRFENEPAQFLAFAQEKKNFDELVEMGLAERPKADREVIAPKEKPKASETPPEEE